MNKWARAFYQPNLPLRPGERVTASKEHIALSKEAAQEGMVLLKNEGGVLPLAEGTRVVLLGKGSFDYVKGGGGSGDVNTVYVRNLYDGLKADGSIFVYEPVCDFYRANVAEQYAKGAAPGMTVEPALPEELLAGAVSYTDTAIVTISRFSGEGWDRSEVECNEKYNPWAAQESMPVISGRVFPEGDFYLNAGEKAMVAQATANFANVIVLLNIGGVIDTSWIKQDDRIAAAVVMGQGGMEGGLAAAELLAGKVNPSGKLTDTYAAHLEDYPSTANFHESADYVEYTEDIYVGYRYFETVPGAADSVVYPFGYGMSYTQFEVKTVSAGEQDGKIRVQVLVTNIGKRAGKEVVQVYYGAPQGLLKKPAKELAAFEKTRMLLPGEGQLLTLEFAVSDMASFDDLGKVAKSACVLEQGEYVFYAGTCVRAEKIDYTYTVSENTVTKQLAARLVPTSLAKRMLADGSYEELPQSAPHDINECIFEKFEPGIEEGMAPVVRARGQYLLLNPYGENHPLIEVAEGKITMDEFLAQIPDERLMDLLGGQPNTGVGNVYGYGNLPEFGVPNMQTADGPAGVRLHEGTGVRTTAWPCATLIASSWNTELAERVGRAGGEEIKENNLAVWLTPAVNIHRNPLCGRNFEYYSEDPLVSGKIGAAAVRGIQSQHVAAAVKHFACNNKETNRKHSDSRVSERAMREIYLRVFEIIVKEADPWVIMSSYNAINGRRASESHELLEDILRGEWGYRGMVTSDWWTRGEHYKEIKAGNDVKMACGYTDRVMKAMEMGAIDRTDLERCARRVFELMMKLD